MIASKEWKKLRWLQVHCIGIIFPLITKLVAYVTTLLMSCLHIYSVMQGTESIASKVCIILVSGAYDSSRNPLP